MRDFNACEGFGFSIVSAWTCNKNTMHHGNAWFSSESTILDETGKRKRLESLFLTGIPVEEK